MQPKADTTDTETRSGGYGSRGIPKRFQTGYLRAVLKFLYPPMPTVNIIPQRTLEQIRSVVFKPNSCVLNVGSGRSTGCGRRLWKAELISRCYVINMDIGNGDKVTLQGDAQQLPFANESVDAVLMQAVVEHLMAPENAVEEAWRVLKPGGMLYIEMPFLQGFHADPHDYQRYTLPGIRQRLKRYHECASGVSVGPFCTIVWLLRDGLSSCFTYRPLYLLARFILGWLLSPIRFLDFLIRNNPAAYRLANEYYYLCQKPSQ